MEHYDGPAFYRKFPVKPTPVKREAPITERAESQVKERQRRNTRGERMTQKPVTTPHPDTAEVTSAAEKPNYRPFQVTEVPKQLHWTHRESNSQQQHYQRLIAQLKKTDDSFLRLVTPSVVTSDEDQTASDETVTTQAVSTPTRATTHQGSVTASDDPTPVPAVDEPAPVTASTPADRASSDPQDDAETPMTVVDEQETVSSVTTNPEAPAGVALPAAPEPAATDSEPTSPEPMVTTPTEAPHEPAGEDPEAQATLVEPKPTEIFYPEVPVEQLSEKVADTPVGEPEAEPEAVASTPDSNLTSRPVTPSTMDYLPVGTVPQEDRGGDPVTPNDESTNQADHDVQRLLARTEEPEHSTESVTPTKAAAQADTQSTDVQAETPATTDQQPAETADTDDQATPTEPATISNETHQTRQTPVATKPKAKPTRGLGHSLGDIMQEEGNDQRDLALFAGGPHSAATPAPTPADLTARGYHFPDIGLLPKPVVPDEQAMDEWIEHQATVLDATLSAFHVDAHVTDWTIGPTVTQFQVKLALGVKVSKITNLNDDLKLALAAKDIRIEAPIPGKTTVGIEIPNKKSRPVMLSEILNSPAFQHSESPLTVALGVDLFGQPQVTDLRKMPHGLIAGATGSGKSVFINSLLLSILYKANPQQVKLLLIDPKAVEMAPYDGLPHLLAPVISDPKAAAAALKWVVTEMDQRYEKLAAAGVRNIEQFNDRADANDEPGLKMPYIVIIIDELADLMMMAASEVQDYIVRITQKARAAGIHLLVATQRPSVDIVTGTIKNNIPTRIAFMVSSQIDSRTILDTTGAESLLGRGDMLYLGNGASQPMRLQGAFVEAEVDRVTDFVRTQGKPQYAFEPNGLLKQETDAENQDELLPKVLEYIAQEKTVSTSKLQRVFSIGYNRAANLIDDLEQHNYVSPQHGSKPREVYLTPDDLGKDLPEPHDQDAPFSS
ncbi:DNA translocase FtsK [Levilactobacillus namurensis]|uniref:DNA translocase FtsK n=1 Tax=Levilactobacillus namurensis TaxID=380393 RepID=UPI001DA8112E|nr:DNA translocase FtsK [Levilactobacillus namurensis]HJE45958.1 DUF87 domain-containing protein [Levilactobacillus namurensis]